MLSKNMYILGDFNLRDERTFTPFNEILSRHSLYQIIDTPTRGDNILDLIVTNNINTVISKYIYNPQLSDHSYTECNLNLIRPKVPKITISYRKFNSLNKENVLKSMDSLQLDNIVSTYNATNTTLSTILTVFNKYAPFKNKTIYQYPSKKFISQQTKDLIKIRDIAYNKYRGSRDQVNRTQFLQLKKRVSAAIYRDTKLEFSNKVQSLQLWGALNKLYPRPNPPPLINICPDKINAFFAAISTTSPSTPVPTLPVKPPLPWDNSEKTFKFVELTIDDMNKT